MPKAIEYSLEDLKYIKENWEKETISSMSKKLGCSRKAVSNQAKKMGLELPGQIWTDEQDQFLKENIELSAKEIAEKIGKTEQAIYNRISRLGLTKTPNWTLEEEELLELYWGCEPVETIAKRVNKTVVAVLHKSKRMNLGNFFDANGEYLKVSQIENVLNVSGDKIRKNWFKNGLKFKKLKSSKNKFIYGVKIEDLFLFLEKNQNAFDARFLVPNILGPEPKWLIEKRKQDYKNPPSEYRIWNKSEIEILKFLLSKGKTQKEIGDKINRSESAVKYKVSDLGLSEVRRWQPDEEEWLHKNFKENLQMSNEEMASYLGRSKTSVSKRCRKLGYYID